MAYIEYVDDETDSTDGRRHRRDNILGIHGVHPGFTRAHIDCYVSLMRGDGPLTRAQREMIAVVVSSINGCHY